MIESTVRRSGEQRCCRHKMRRGVVLRMREHFTQDPMDTTMVSRPGAMDMWTTHAAGRVPYARP